MNWTSKLLKNFFALLLGIIISFFILEGALRIYNPLDFRVKGDKIILPANKKYVIRRDKLQKKYTKFDETIIHSKNSLGFRGEEPPLDLSKYLTIITVGGSTTECTFLSDGKTWTDLLGKKIKGTFKNIWINNAGFDGQSTFGHAILMKDYILKLKPDIVLFLVGANDQDRDDIGEQDMEIMRNKYAFYSMKGFLKSMANHSEVFSLGLNFYRYWKALKIGVEHGEIDFRIYKNVDISKFETDENIKLRKKTVETSKAMYAEGYRRRLQALIDISIENGITPVLITQPSFYGDFIDDVTNVDFRFTAISWEILEIYNNITRQVGEKNNIIVVDLAREMPKSSKYYYDWLHFTNQGAEKVAEIIYNNIHSFIAGNYPEFSEELQ